MCAHPLPPDPLLNILTRHGPRTVTGAVRGPQAERLEVRRSEFEKRAGCGERRRVIENAGASGEEVPDLRKLARRISQGLQGSDHLAAEEFLT